MLAESKNERSVYWGSNACTAAPVPSNIWSKITHPELLLKKDRRFRHAPRLEACDSAKSLVDDCNFLIRSIGVDVSQATCCNPRSARRITTARRVRDLTCLQRLPDHCLHPICRIPYASSFATFASSASRSLLELSPQAIYLLRGQLRPLSPNHSRETHLC